MPPNPPSFHVKFSGNRTATESAVQLEITDPGITYNSLHVSCKRLAAAKWKREINESSSLTNKFTTKGLIDHHTNNRHSISRNRDTLLWPPPPERFLYPVAAACRQSVQFRVVPFRGFVLLTREPFRVVAEWQVDFHKLRHLWYSSIESLLVSPWTVRRGNLWSSTAGITFSATGGVFTLHCCSAREMQQFSIQGRGDIATCSVGLGFYSLGRVERIIVGIGY